MTRARPAVGARLDQPEHDAGHAEGGGERAGDVEVAVTALGLAAAPRVPRAQTAIPIGTLTNITQRHETSSVSSPPATSPMAPRPPTRW